MSEVTKGVKYLKINRLDADGEDYGSRIQNADNIRINFEDVGPVQYNILTVQQQSDYYLLGVINQPITSSNPGRFGFSLIASSSYSSYAATPTSLQFLQDPSKILYIQSYTSKSGDGISNFSGGTYTFPATPNERITINFTCSIYNSNPGQPDDTFNVYLYSKNETYTLFTLTVNNSPSPVTHSGSITSNLILENDYYNIGIQQSSTSNARVAFSRFQITSSPISTPPTTLLNISPDIVNFANSDDNAIFNNVDIPQYSSIYQDIDYSTGLIPTNFNLLISGNASYAFVQDSNYTATGWVNSRYNGSRVSSIDFNT